MCEQERIDYALAYVGGVMMAVALLELLPEAQVKKKSFALVYTHKLTQTHTHTLHACMHVRQQSLRACIRRTLAIRLMQFYSAWAERVCV